MTLLAGWGALLARLSGQEDLVIGTPVANRGRMEIEGLIGFFVNTLALRLDVSGSPSVVELLERVKEQTLAAQQNQDIPFEQVVEVVRPARSLSHSPIFQVMFAWQNAPGGALQLPRLEVEKVEPTRMVAKFDLSLFLQEAGERIVGGLKYATALYERATVERYSEYFRRMLKEMVANPESRIWELPLLSEAERNEIIVEWNATEVEYPVERCLHELFSEQVRQSPEAVAVVYEDEQLSYLELERRSNQLGSYLRRFGVGPEVVVGLCVERSVEMIVGLLGILKAGGAYLPLDPAYPEERLKYLLEDAQAPMVVTRQSEREALSWYKGAIVSLEQDWEEIATRPDGEMLSGVRSDNVAYFIYTSGSTGKPKGVAVEHKSLVNYLSWVKRYLLKDTTQDIPAITALTFDASLKQLFGPLLQGKSVWLVGSETISQSAALLRAIKRRNRVSLNCVPALWKTMLEAWKSDEENLSELNLGTLLIGGEHFSQELVEKTLAALPEVEIWNIYGPTECTANAAVSRLQAMSEPTIGRPISNTKIYILDKRLEPVAIGSAGELHIGGDAVARGYLNRSELSAERFIPSPFSSEPGARLYKTGDVVCYLPDGDIKFLGRIDHQVKVRGYRIEPGEVEERLREYSGIEEAAVVAQGESDADKRLVAYYTGLEIGAKALRDHLFLILPEYMVPVAYVYLESLPLMPNGKLNRRLLPAPDSLAFTQRGYEPPVGQIESELAGIWAELLKVERVGRRDNFFELGGHSLLIIRIVSRLRKTLNVEVTIRDVFEHAVLADLAAAVQEATPATLPPITPAERDGDLPLSFAQQRLWFLAQIGASEAYHIFKGWRLKGRLDGGALRRALDQIVARHEALRTTFVAIEGEPVQRIAAAEESPFHLVEYDLVGMPDVQTKLKHLVREEATAGFDLEAGPLIRGRLVGVGEEEHALLITMHHIVSDGWSMGVFIRELSMLYGAFARGEEDPLPELECAVCGLCGVAAQVDGRRDSTETGRVLGEDVGRSAVAARVTGRPSATG